MATEMHETNAYFIGILVFQYLVCVGISGMFDLHFNELLFTPDHDHNEIKARNVP